MTRKVKLLTSLSTLTLAGALALAGCGAEGEGEGEGVEGADAPGLSSEGEGAEGEGAEGEGAEGEGAEGEGAEGEGEGSEGEGEGGAGAADPATDDVAYLHLLGQLRGHLAAYRELRATGAEAAAGAHVKHPESELYGALAPAFAARGRGGFADELAALVAAQAQGGDAEAAYAAVLAAIAEHEPDTDAATRILAASALARTAADEFSIGVAEDGEIVNAHEYQDAYGFLSAARAMLAETEPATEAEREALAEADALVELALSEFDGLDAARTDGRAAAIYGAAARLELAALRLR